MSVDNSIGQESLPASASGPVPTVDADETSVFFHSSARVDAEPGVWSLLLVPVLACIAFLVFSYLIPR